MPTPMPTPIPMPTPMPTPIPIHDAAYITILNALCVGVYKYMQQQRSLLSRAIAGGGYLDKCHVISDVNIGTAPHLGHL